jgi:hypothetical protein
MRRVEIGLHRRFKSKRQCGEWFDLTPEDVEWICSISEWTPELDTELFPKRPRGRGRPPGIARPHKAFTYLDDMELGVLSELERVMGIGTAGVLRHLVLKEAEQRGISLKSDQA